MVEQAQTQDGYVSHRGRSVAQASASYEITKRIIDVMGAVLGLGLALPLLVLIAVLLRVESRGPVLFKQTRVGKRGEPFEILKLRTMYWPPESTLHREHVVNRASELGSSKGKLRMLSDPRITSVGRFLRRWSLDELPNLWNVLKGEMSLVGPRPLVPYETSALGAEACRRLEVKPGITGMAQVEGRLEVSWKRRTAFDVYYVEHRSLGLDMAIVGRTLLSLFRRPGA